jgi:uncharacterized protein (DUF3820 family)
VQYRLTFGKYKGRPIVSVPADYLRWIIIQDWPSDELKELASGALLIRERQKAKSKEKKRLKKGSKQNTRAKTKNVAKTYDENGRLMSWTADACIQPDEDK